MLEDKLVKLGLETYTEYLQEVGKINIDLISSQDLDKFLKLECIEVKSNSNGQYIQMRKEVI